jgi:hypothetical protein
MADPSPELARARAQQHVIVHHPGTNHLAYELVAGLQEGGYACDFHTGFFYTPDGALARMIGAAPPTLRARAERELRRRAHGGVASRRVHLRPWPELVQGDPPRAAARGDRP